MTRVPPILILSTIATLLFPFSALSEVAFDDEVGRFRTELDALVDEARSSYTRPDRGRIEDLYLEHFPDSRLREGLDGHTLDELIALHTATEAAFFYSLSPMLLDRLGRIVTLIPQRLGQVDAGRRNIARRYLEGFRADLLRARRFAQAQTFSERYELDSLPWNVIDETPIGSGPTVLEIALDRASVTLLRTKVDLASDLKIVAVVHPHCGPSRRAMNYIEDNQRLASLFAGRTVWVADAKQTVPLESLVDWNERARETRIAISYDDYAWPEAIGFLHTPVFYFLEDGVVRDMVIGWPGPEQVERIHAAFDAIGVNPAIGPVSR